MTPIVGNHGQAEQSGLDYRRVLVRFEQRFDNE